MTREEEIRQAARVVYGEDLESVTFLHRIGLQVTESKVREDCEKVFIEGAEWADSHPINQWHKVKEFPPEDPKHKGWSVKVIVINDGQHDIGFYDYKLKRWCVPGCINPYFTNITHWQTFPELPKKK